MVANISNINLAHKANLFKTNFSSVEYKTATVSGQGSSGRDRKDENKKTRGKNMFQINLLAILDNYEPLLIP